MSSELIEISSINSTDKLFICGKKGKKKIEIPVKLRYLSPEAQARINSKLLTPHVILEDIKIKQGKLSKKINFNTQGVEFSLKIIRNNLAYSLSPIYIKSTTIGISPCILILSRNKTASKIDRRRAERYPVNKVMPFHQASKRIDATVTDISRTGVGFVTSDSQLINKDNIIYLDFIAYNSSIKNIPLKVVRFQSLSNGNVKVGCSALSAVSYIMATCVETVKHGNKPGLRRFSDQAD